MNKTQRQQKIEELQQEIQKLKNMSDFDLDGRLIVDGEIVLMVRNYGEFKEKSWWLSSDFDWQMKRDLENNLCLIIQEKQMKKENEMTCEVKVSGPWNCKEFKENFDDYEWTVRKDKNGEFYLFPKANEKHEDEGKWKMSNW